MTAIATAIISLFFLLSISHGECRKRNLGTQGGDSPIYFVYSMMNSDDADKSLEIKRKVAEVATAFEAWNIPVKALEGNFNFIGADNADKSTSMIALVASRQGTQGITIDGVMQKMSQKLSGESDIPMRGIDELMQMDMSLDSLIEEVSSYLFPDVSNYAAVSSGKELKDLIGSTGMGDGFLCYDGQMTGFNRCRMLALGLASEGGDLSPYVFDATSVSVLKDIVGYLKLKTYSGRSFSDSGFRLYYISDVDTSGRQVSANNREFFGVPTANQMMVFSHAVLDSSPAKSVQVRSFGCIEKACKNNVALGILQPVNHAKKSVIADKLKGVFQMITMASAELSQQIGLENCQSSDGCFSYILCSSLEHSASPKVKTVDLAKKDCPVGAVLMSLENDLYSEGDAMEFEPYIEPFDPEFDDEIEEMVHRKKIKSGCYHCEMDPENCSDVNSKNIGSFLKKHRIVFLFFHLNVDTKSKGTTYIFHEAANKLASKGVISGDNSPMGKVACHHWPEICEEYNVRTFPRILIMKDGAYHSTYNGIWSPDSIVNSFTLFLKESPIILNRIELMDDILKDGYGDNRMPFALGLFSSLVDLPSKTFREVSQELHGQFPFYFALTSSAQYISNSKYMPGNPQVPTLMVFHPAGPLKKATIQTFKGRYSKENVMKFLMDSFLPDLPELTVETAPALFRRSGPYALMALQNCDAESDLLQDFATAASSSNMVDYLSASYLCWSSNKDLTEAILEGFGLTFSDLPLVVVSNPVKGESFVYPADKLTSSDSSELLNWLTNVKNGKASVFRQLEKKEFNKRELLYDFSSWLLQTY